MPFGAADSREGPEGKVPYALRKPWRDGTTHFALDPWEALLKIEVGQPFAFPSRPGRAAGAWVLHPGAGTLRAVEGVEQARAVAGACRIALELPPGPPAWQVPPRLGSGQDLGAIYAEGDRAEAVASALTAAHERLRFVRE